MTSSRSASAARSRFLHKLEAAKSSAELRSLLAECPPPTAVGHQFYSNLAFFIEHFVPPRAADVAETLQYIKLFDKLRSRGEASEEARAQVVAKFKEAHANRH